jgi:hypothetical protein
VKRGDLGGGVAGGAGSDAAGFNQGDREAGTLEQQRSRQAGDAAADDGDVERHAGVGKRWVVGLIGGGHPNRGVDLISGFQIRRSLSTAPD